MRRFFAPPENFKGENIKLGIEETRHLRDVLRLHEGDQASVFNGLGLEYSCTIKKISKKDALLSIVKKILPTAPESPLELTLAAAILPGEKFDLVVQKAVELGIVTLQPLYTKRCEARPEAGGRRLERWKKIALEAAKQSGRAKLMDVAESCQIAEFLPRHISLKSENDSLILFSERNGSGFSEIIPGKQMTAVIGPKGGWEDSELDLARDIGFSIVTFGGRILRAETAAIAMSAILQHRFGDLS